MILVRSPLRITLGGGGTDLPAYATRFGGFCLTAAITQYVYVSVTKPFRPGIYLKYSEIEHVNKISDVRHRLIQTALRRLEIPPKVEITTLADIPAGTGLGSSSSFTSALVLALITFKREHISTQALAELSLDIEHTCSPSIGYQDAFAAAYGGLSHISNEGSTVTREPIRVRDPQALNDTNRISLRVLPHQSGHVLLMARLDNLGKGAAGVAIQNLNLMLGVPEDTGLPR